jgi:putative ABC transport system permease protein
MLFKLSFRSILNRKLTTSLTLLSIALSVALYLSIQQIRYGARENFSNTINQTDLIVGAKGGSLQLLLYSIFHMGSATQNISFATYSKWSSNPAIDWTIPISLGDSHRGFRVVGTNDNFYKHYRFHHDHSIGFVAGTSPSDIFDVVLGAEVAHALNYKIGDSIVLSHGISEGESIFNHGDKPFKITGILNPTRTAVDRALYINLEGLEAIHMDWKDGVPPDENESTKPELIRKKKIKIGQITSFLMRAKSRIDVLRIQREINNETSEPLMAVIPGVALSELWRGLSYAENALQAISAMVILVGLLGMLVSIYTSLNERRREIAILRSIGATKFKIMGLLVIESCLLSFFGSIFGVALMFLALFILKPILEFQFGIFIELRVLSLEDFIFLGAVVGFGIVLGILPALKAYRNSLIDGLATRL